MVSLKRAVILPGLITGLIAISGCGGGAGEETNTTETSVKGTVKLDGQLASGGTISFDPSNYKRQVPPIKAPIGKDGTYTVKTLVGQNVVTLEGDVAKKHPILQHTRRLFTAQAGDNTFDFEANGK